MIKQLEELGYTVIPSVHKFGKEVITVKQDDKMVGYFFLDEIKDKTIDEIVGSIKDYEQRNKKSIERG
jgi:hypothetical protein